MSSQLSSARPVRQPASRDAVLVDVRNHIGHLTLNRPAGLNAIDLDMVRTLKSQLDAWAEDEDVYAIVLRGAGGKAFCAGGDIRALYESHRKGMDLHHTFFAEEYALDLTIHGYRKPVMALMDGLVLGGGMGLVQGADLRVVTERSRLGMPEVAIGYFPDVGGSYFLSRLPGELGTWMGVTGTRIGAADALYCGLANWSMSSEMLPRLDHMLDHLKWKSTPLKDLQGAMAKLATQRLPYPPLELLRPVIDHFFRLPDIPSILEQLQAVTIADSRQWALETVSLMKSHSPLAMAVTLEMLRRGRHLTLQACFDMELHLDRQWFERGDLIEGVRALIIDKDKKPHWKHDDAQDVSAAHVQSFFNGLES
ncbi:enoyl-CoA hydratase/isomerase family protein [Pseudomonas sp. CDFA 602]|uniref:enoyl-CoA hydratase/isomerase family protein n=1 Tax=Pseudomonas californiensis TaxID=2829823 RepID=UPI001E49046C|nr:enoyl-CoA hydratase/isomerase family protein [Pseudomonas californiensis]MCD5992659.1 enoyl-CoA hydratase/isomerase family protein [Pseudomonas californiensis]MCD5998063.1 enoyl-CoA hydratase/isomerase family protein [Pseudomonas californiensis]